MAEHHTKQLAAFLKELDKLQECSCGEAGCGDSETDYLLKSKANAERLKESIEQLETPIKVFTVDLSELSNLDTLDESQLDGKLDEVLAKVFGEEFMQEHYEEDEAVATRYPSEAIQDSTYAAFSHEYNKPVPLPSSVSSEEEAVAHMERNGYQHFEVYLKLGTYKVETKKELVKQ